MHQIRCFLAASDALNLTNAAERCNVAQPSLTRVIKALKKQNSAASCLGAGADCRIERNFAQFADHDSF